MVFRVQNKALIYLMHSRAGELAFVYANTSRPEEDPPGGYFLRQGCVSALGQPGTGCFQCLAYVYLETEALLGKSRRTTMPGYRRHISKPIRWLGWLLFTAAILIGFLSRLSALLTQPTHITDLQRVKDRTRLTFPPGAFLEDGYEYSLMSCWFIARVRLPRPQVRAFLSQTLHHSAVQDQEIDDQFQNGFHWMRQQHWPIPNPHKFQSTHFEGEGASNPASGCAVLVDLDDPRIAIIYLYYYY